MSLNKVSVLSIFLIVLLSEEVFAFYNEEANCTFSQIQKPTCVGPGTTAVADYARLYLESHESYGVLWHPCGLMFFAKVIVTGAYSLTHKLHVNGIYAYINKVDGEFYYFPTIGCEKPHVLRDCKKHLPGLNDFTYSQLLKIVIHLTNGYPYKTACNIFPFKSLIGPSPNVAEDLPCANFYMDISGLQSFHIVSYNETGKKLGNALEEVSKQTGCTEVRITSDCHNVVLSEVTLPRVRKCKRKVFDLVDPSKGKYPEISSLQPNSACFWATLVSEKFTTLVVDRDLYVYWGINKYDNSGVVYMEGYMPSNAVDITFDPLYYVFC